MRARRATRPSRPISAIEKFCNPFLRCDQPRLLEKFGGPKKDPATAFGAIRAAKDKF